MCQNNNVPPGHPKCKLFKLLRCELDYNIVEEKLYKEECKVNVQHICEEHIRVPIPYPVKDQYREKLEKLEYSHPHGPPEAKKLDHKTPYPNYGHTNHLPTPRPTPSPHLAYQPSVLGAALVGDLFHRHTRAADEADDAIQEMVKHLLFNPLELNLKKATTSAKIICKCSFAFQQLS